jgi:hypothetical protein
MPLAIFSSGQKVLANKKVKIENKIKYEEKKDKNRALSLSQIILSDSDDSGRN